MGVLIAGFRITGRLKHGGTLYLRYDVKVANVIGAGRGFPGHLLQAHSGPRGPTWQGW